MREDVVPGRKSPIAYFLPSKSQKTSPDTFTGVGLASLGMRDA
jgi:hypothetical protein